MYLLLLPFQMDKANSYIYVIVNFTNEILFLSFGSISMTQSKGIFLTMWLFKILQLTEQLMNDTKNPKALTGLTVTKCHVLRQAKNINLKISHEICMCSVAITTLHESGKETPPSKPATVFCIIFMLAFIIAYFFFIQSQKKHL